MLIARPVISSCPMAEKSCFICLEKESRYTCPACGTKTCSAECVKRHKLRSECTGEVDPAKFVPRKEMTENPSLINRDYNYLLNFERKIGLGVSDTKQNARVMFKRHPGQNKRQRVDDTDARITRVNKMFNSPSYALKRENVLVISLPSGMSRATQNKSGYDKKAGTYTWTVEWVPVNEDGRQLTSFTSFRIKEDIILRDALSVTPLANALGVDPESVEKDKIHFSIENVISMGKRSIIKLNPDDTLAKALANKVVLEYPKLYVTFSPETWQEFTEEEKDAYGIDSDLESESDSDSSSSDSLSSDSDSDSSDSDAEAPEEASSKNPEPEPLAPQSITGLNSALASSDKDEEEGFSA